MSTWDLKALRDDVELLYGRDQRKDISPSLDSILQRGEFAKFHYREADRLMIENIPSEEKHGEIMMMLFGGDDASDAFEEVRFQAAAHITACVQSMHATADILAHALYFALGMNLTPKTTLEPHRIGLKAVLPLVSNNHIKRLVSKLRHHDGFRYIEALNNHSKHRSIVQTPYSLSLIDGPVSHGLKFSEFEYSGKKYEARWVKQALSDEYKRQSRLIVSIGQSLNEALNALATIKNNK